MTFSIAAFCRNSGHFGVAVTSSSICVASRCAFARSGVGAALSQNVTDPSLGPQMLQSCADGLSAQQAVDDCVKATPHAAHRQLGLIDSNGQAATYTGSSALGIHAASSGVDCLSIGNLLENSEVPAAISQSFEESSGVLAQRLITALQAGLAAGGEAGPIKSAGLMVVSDVSWPTVDLRVDWSEADPLTDLQELWTLYEPQSADYRTRALDPNQAPSYGVPGDL